VAKIKKTQKMFFTSMVKIDD